MELTLAEIENFIELMQSDYLTRKGRRDQLISEKEKLQKIREKLREEIDIFEQTRILLQQTAEFAREQARQQLEILVTQALQFVFETNMEFKIEIGEVRGKPEAEFFVVSTYGQTRVEAKPQDARGGGVVDVVSLALRLAILHTYQPTPEGPLILDEPAKHVSEEFIGNVGKFLRDISRYFNRQIIMITHETHLSEIADKAFRVELKDGKSQVCPIFSLT